MIYKSAESSKHSEIRNQNSKIRNLQSITQKSSIHNSEIIIQKSEIINQ